MLFVLKRPKKMLKPKRKSLRRSWTPIEIQDRALKRAQADIVRLERDLVGLHQLREAQDAAAKALPMIFLPLSPQY